ncbi:hypothetical protein E3N88_34366 [Mikania micrantha]|uniref:Uncharacterized protein n=1 Tax=Mikania micrantha TaxID=192012 RepID=A0A5N6LYT6_9ASTR|nr:hypothetical protein E3N88_34366 [Mikania micrantha]
MANVGENRARNGVTDCPESRSGDKNQKMDENHLGRYAPSHTSDLGDARGWHQIYLAALLAARVFEVSTVIEKKMIFERHRPRSSRKCVMKVPAAVGHNMRTAVKGAAYAYDGLNDLNHVMIYVKKSCTAMADQGERDIYQRFPYVILDDTPSSSSGSDSDPSEAVSLASNASAVPPIPPLPEPVLVPPSPPVLPIIPSPPHSPPTEPVADQRQSITPPRVPAWDGLRRMRGQARKTTGLPPRRQMAPRDEPTTIHEVGESSHQAELREQVQQISQDLQALRQDVSQHHTLLEDTRTTVLEILTSHLTLMEQVNVLGANTQAWRATMEERLRRTWRQALVVTFWQEVALWSERWVYLRQLVSTMSLEARLMMIVIVMVAIAIVISCLPFFIR